MTVLYLVAPHVVTLVHDQRLTSLVVLSNIQAGLRSSILNLVQTQTHNNSKKKQKTATVAQLLQCFLQLISKYRQRET